MNLKMKMAFIFQPYLILMLLGCFATYGYLRYAESKYMAFIGVAIVLGSLYGYIKVLMKKVIVFRNAASLLVLTIMCVLSGIGEANYSFGTTSSVIMAVMFFSLFIMDVSFLNEILKDSKFIKDYNHKPDMTLFIEDMGALNLFKPAKERKIKSRAESFTYINNDIKFDSKGVKETNITYNEIDNYLQDSMVDIKDFNNDSIKTIEMLRY